MSAKTRKALSRVAKTQKKFWDAMLALENATGVDLESTYDFIDYIEPTDEDVDEVLRNFAEK